MKRNTLILLISCFVLYLGCASTTRPLTDLTSWLSSPRRDNPVFVPTSNHVALMNTLEDVLDNHYVISATEPIRLHENVFTEGRIDTEPKISASILEPWHTDSTNINDRMERTFQTIRSRASVRVVPENNGFWIQVFVYNELENMPAPMGANIAVRDVRFTQNQERIVNPSEDTDSSNNWILIGRDNSFEQQLIREVLGSLKK